MTLDGGEIDVIIGRSAPAAPSVDDVRVMADDPIMLVLANPDAEVGLNETARTGARAGER